MYKRVIHTFSRVDTYVRSMLSHLELGFLSLLRESLHNLVLSYRFLAGDQDMVALLVYPLASYRKKSDHNMVDEKNIIKNNQNYTISNNPFSFLTSAHSSLLTSGR